MFKNFIARIFLGSMVMAFLFCGCNGIKNNQIKERLFYEVAGHRWCYAPIEGGVEIVVDGESGKTVVPAPVGRLKVPAFLNNQPVISIGESALACELKITSVELPSTIKNIGEYAFAGSHKLKEIFISSSVTNICLLGLDRLESINVNEENRHYCSIDGVLYNREVTQLLVCPSGKNSVIIPQSVTNIVSGAFWGCGKLKTLTIPASVRTVGSFAFGMTYMKSIYFQGDAPQCHEKYGVFDRPIPLPTIYVHKGAKGWRDKKDTLSWQGANVKYIEEGGLR